MFYFLHFSTVSPGRARKGSVFFDIFHDVADGFDIADFLFGNFNLEFVFKRHDQIHKVQAVGVQVFFEQGVFGYLIRLQIKDETGKVMHYAEGIYFETNGVIYKIEYAGLDGYYDANVDLYAMLQTLTLKA